MKATSKLFGTIVFRPAEDDASGSYRDYRRGMQVERAKEAKRQRRKAKMRAAKLKEDRLQAQEARIARFNHKIRNLEAVKQSKLSENVKKRAEEEKRRLESLPPALRVAPERNTYVTGSIDGAIHLKRAMNQKKNRRPSQTKPNKPEVLLPPSYHPSTSTFTDDWDLTVTTSLPSLCHNEFSPLMWGGSPLMTRGGGAGFGRPTVGQTFQYSSVPTLPRVAGSSNNTTVSPGQATSSRPSFQSHRTPTNKPSSISPKQPRNSSPPPQLPHLFSPIDPKRNGFVNPLSYN